MKLYPNSSLQYIDQNAFRAPKYPFEVIFQATEVMHPEFRFDTIDIITNRNSLRHFLDFCQGRTQESFRVNLFMVKNTLIIERCVKTAAQWIHEQNTGAGLGHAFERAVTELPADLQGSTSHHRVLRYNLAGLECAVRFEVDACVHAPPESSPTASKVNNSSAMPPAAVDLDPIGDLVSSVHAMTFQDKENSDGRSCVVAIPRGHGTDQNSTGEIKSSAKRPKSKGASLAQMWFGRTPWLIRGTHEAATYNQVLVENLSRDLREWETREDIQVALKRTSALLSRLRDLVKATGKESCVLIYAKGQSNLCVFLSTSGQKPLPDKVVDRFWDREREDA